METFNRQDRLSEEFKSNFCPSIAEVYKKIVKCRGNNNNTLKQETFGGWLEMYFWYYVNDNMEYADDTYQMCGKLIHSADNRGRALPGDLSYFMQDDLWKELEEGYESWKFPPEKQLKVFAMLCDVAELATLYTGQSYMWHLKFKFKEMEEMIRRYDMEELYFRKLKKTPNIYETICNAVKTTKEYAKLNDIQFPNESFKIIMSEEEKEEVKQHLIKVLTEKGKCTYSFARQLKVFHIDKDVDLSDIDYQYIADTIGEDLFIERDEIRTETYAYKLSTKEINDRILWMKYKYKEGNWETYKFDELDKDMQILYNKNKFLEFYEEHCAGVKIYTCNPSNRKNFAGKEKEFLKFCKKEK